MRTPKKQAIYGRVFHNTGEVRAAMSAFAETCKVEWCVEKLGLMGPGEARQNLEAALAT